MVALRHRRFGKDESQLEPPPAGKECRQQVREIVEDSLRRSGGKNLATLRSARDHPDFHPRGLAGLDIDGHVADVEGFRLRDSKFF